MNALLTGAPPRFSVIAHNIRSLHNVGSLFRSADALGVSHIFLTGYTPTPPRREIHKVALGAEEWVAWTRAPVLWRLLSALHAKRVKIVALESCAGGIDVRRFKPSFPLAVLAGNEVHGLSAAFLKRADSIVEIPMQGRHTSLNVSVAFGIAVFSILGHIKKQHCCAGEIQNPKLKRQTKSKILSPKRLLL